MKKVLLLALLVIAPFRAQAQNSADESYQLGQEMLRSLLSNIERDKFNLSINLAATIKPSSDEPVLIDVFDLQAVLRFKHNPQGIKIPLQMPDEKMSEEKRKLLLVAQTNLSDKLAVLRFKRTENENEFAGDLLFYSRTKSGRIKPDVVTLTVQSEILEFKTVFLYGAKMRVRLAGPHSTKEEIKKGLLNALLECRADTEVVDVFNGTLEQVPLEKCLFQFEKEQIRIEYHEKNPFL